MSAVRRESKCYTPLRERVRCVPGARAQNTCVIFPRLRQKQRGDRRCIFAAPSAWRTQSLHEIQNWQDGGRGLASGVPASVAKDPNMREVGGKQDWLWQITTGRMYCRKMHLWRAVHTSRWPAPTLHLAQASGISSCANRHLLVYSCHRQTVRAIFIYIQNIFAG